jgi:predicted regulator of amino acid metabolism with ACT domain
MWKHISELFSGLPAQRSVARKIIELGLSIGADGTIRCGDVEVKEVSLAKAAGVDRRIVRATVASILSDKELASLFAGIKPAGALLRDVAHNLGFGAVEIEADAAKPAIIAKATALLANKKISIRQVYAKDPELFENPSLVIITERQIPGALLNEFSKIPGVTKVSIL